MLIINILFYRTSLFGHSNWICSIMTCTICIYQHWFSFSLNYGAFGFDFSFSFSLVGQLGSRCGSLVYSDRKCVLFFLSISDVADGVCVRFSPQLCRLGKANAERSAKHFPAMIRFLPVRRSFFHPHSSRLPSRDLEAHFD